MKGKIINLLNELLIVQMNHWILFTAAVTMLGLLDKDRPYMIEWGVCSIFPFILYLIRQKYNKFIPFALFHMVVIVGMFIMIASEVIMVVIFSMYICGYVINSIYIKLKSKDMTDKVISPVIAVLITAFMVLLQYYQGNKEWDVYYSAALIAYLGMYFIHYYLQQYFDFIKINEGIASHTSNGKIFHSGMGVTLIYTVFCVGVLFLTANIGWMLGIVIQLKKVMVWLLNLLLKLIGSDNNVYMEPDLAEQDAVEETEPIDDLEKFWLWDVLEIAIMTALAALVVFLLIRGLVIFIRFLKEIFKKKPMAKNFIYQDIEDVREKCEVAKSNKSLKKSLISFLSPTERIRRIYKKRILEGKEVLIGNGDTRRLNTFTTRECERSVKIGELADIYEKARYSNYECSGDDVKRAKLRS